MEFREVVWDFYRQNKRDLPWRRDITPYKILLSEVMLQQTQVSRVTVKFTEWLEKFPSLETLAQADLPPVLKTWQGLGYNRRGKFLWETAKKIGEEFGGQLPRDPNVLATCPGIGINTAGAIVAYAFNQPVIFIETNIRRVFLHHFFEDEQGVSDRQLVPLIEENLDRQNPREWYWALMDYGSFLAKTVENPNRRSRHYTKQSKFEGSNRQLRAKMLRYILENPTITRAEVLSQFQEDERAGKNLEELEKEGLVRFGED